MKLKILAVLALLIMPLAGVAETETITLPDGEIEDGQGEIVKGKVTIAYLDGRVMEGPIVNGKKHGKWTITFLGGGMNEGRYVYGKKHGKWLYILPSGAIHEGKYIYGMEHGKWMFVSPNGEIKKQKYVYGELQE